MFPFRVFKDSDCNLEVEDLQTDGLSDKKILSLQPKLLSNSSLISSRGGYNKSRQVTSKPSLSVKPHFGYVPQKIISALPISSFENSELELPVLSQKSGETPPTAPNSQCLVSSSKNIKAITFDRNKFLGVSNYLKSSDSNVHRVGDEPLAAQTQNSTNVLKMVLNQKSSMVLDLESFKKLQRESSGEDHRASPKKSSIVQYPRFSDKSSRGIVSMDATFSKSSNQLPPGHDVLRKKRVTFSRNTVMLRYRLAN